MGQSTPMTIAIIAIVVMAVGVGFVAYKFSTTSTTEATTETVVAQVEVAGCNGGTSVTETIKGYDKEKPGTAVTLSNNYFSKPEGLGNQSVSSMTLGTQTEHSVLAGWLSTTYYPEVYTFKTGCNKADRSVYLEKAGAATLSAVNDDGVTKNSASNTQTIDASDTREVVIYLDEAVDSYFGADDCNVAVASFDKTYISSVELYSDGNKLVKTGVPSPFNYFNSSFDGSEAYTFRQVKDGEKLEFTARIFSTTSNPDGLTGGVRINFYDCGGDVATSEDGRFMFAVEDEDSHELSLVPANLTISIA